jgi:hypothetical protein
VDKEFLWFGTVPRDLRRSRAVGIIAQPQTTLTLLTQTAANDRKPADRAAAAGAGAHVDPRPPATLYVHVSQDAITRDATGVARFEGHGPITPDQAKAWLGHCQVAVKPVIDLTNQTPVDGYEIPDRLREAICLRNPVDNYYLDDHTGTRPATRTPA